MKRVPQISIAIFFVLTTLMGSIGLSLHKMACFESGKVTLTLEQFFCCSADGQKVPSNSVTAVCCDFDQLEFKVSAFEINKNSSDFTATPPAYIDFSALLISLEAPLLFLYEKYIPPLPGSKRLALFCTYRI